MLESKLEDEGALREDDRKEIEDKLEGLKVLKSKLQKHTIVHQNQLKFRINAEQKLVKADHVGRIAEAYSEDKETWLGALVQDVDGEQLEITWIGG